LLTLLAATWRTLIPEGMISMTKPGLQVMMEELLSSMSMRIETLLFSCGNCRCAGKSSN